MYYQQSVTDVLKQLNSDPQTGLTRIEAQKRLTRYGSNLLPEKKKPPIILKFFAQFRNVLVLILLAATVFSFVLGDRLDAFAILTIVLLNAAIGFIQEIQAEKTLESLREKEILYAMVLRDDQAEKIPAAEIVPGDILILEEGAKIPADARIIEAFTLKIDESILTGESSPAAKNPASLLSRDIPLADRVNMVFKDTKVTSGRAKAVVVETGGGTEIGKIARYLEENRRVKSPLATELEKVGHSLTMVIIFIAAIIFILNFRAKISLVESLLISISLAVAAIPEGLPAIVTIVLSLGVKRLAAKNTLVKKLPAVETLGAVRIIATDKTGTLTQNKINAVSITTSSGGNFTIEGDGFNPEGVFFDGKKNIIDPRRDNTLKQLLKAAALANNASFNAKDNSVLGDTTEAALLVAARRANLDTDGLKSSFKRIYEVPFTSERKMMSVVVEVDDASDYILYAKGAPEVINAKCLNPAALTSRGEGLRALAVAYRRLSKNEIKKALELNQLSEDKLTYLGTIFMQDPLRNEVASAIAAAKDAGIRTIMITGDHRETAVSIARQAGIISDDPNGNKSALTEEELIKLSDDQLIHALKSGASVFARISPFNKLRIVEAIKKLPNTQVAVTGDGVNDAPALSAAHIGVAMGQTGTDVTREVADIVLTDDNYATIVSAVEEGRIIYANLVKFIRYLISCNLSEVIVVAAGVFFATPLPLLPIQILWINLITDGLPAIALGVDPPEYDVMKKPPRDLTEGILHRKRWAYMTIEGIIIGSSVFALFIYGLNNFSYPVAQSLVFAALALSQLVHAFNNRSIRKSVLKVGIFKNRYLVVTAIFSIFLQIMVIQTNWGNFVFKTTSLSLNHWLLVGMVSLVPFIAVEVKKQLRFRILP